jgi:hypothetical protein
LVQRDERYLVVLAEVERRLYLARAFAQQRLRFGQQPGPHFAARPGPGPVKFHIAVIVAQGQLFDPHQAIVEVARRKAR